MASKSKNVIVALTVIVAIGFVGYKVIVVQRNKLQYKKWISDQNVSTDITVDNTFTFRLPCHPSGDNNPTMLNLGEINSVTYRCTQMDEVQGKAQSGNLYSAENETFNSQRYFATDGYSKCDGYKDDTGENMMVIDRHEEEVHGIKFFFCSLAGDRGSNSMTARTMKGNTLQTIWVIGDQQHFKNIWPTFRGNLETFDYINHS